MNKGLINYIVDVILGISFVITTITAFALKPFGMGRTEVLWLTKQTWVAWHSWVGMIMIVVAIIHLILHWHWYVCMTKELFKGTNKKNKC